MRIYKHGDPSRFYDYDDERDGVTRAKGVLFVLSAWAAAWAVLAVVAWTVYMIVQAAS